MPHHMKTKLTTRIKYAWYALTGNYWSAGGEAIDGSDYIVMYSRKPNVRLVEEDYFIAGLMAMQSGVAASYLEN